MLVSRNRPRRERSGIVEIVLRRWVIRRRADSPLPTFPCWSFWVRTHNYLACVVCSILCTSCRSSMSSRRCADSFRGSSSWKTLTYKGLRYSATAVTTPKRRAHAAKSANVNLSSRLTTILLGLTSRCNERCLCSVLRAVIYTIDDGTLSQRRVEATWVCLPAWRCIAGRCDPLGPSIDRCLSAREEHAQGSQILTAHASDLPPTSTVLSENSPSWVSASTSAARRTSLTAFRTRMS